MRNIKVSVIIITIILLQTVVFSDEKTDNNKHIIGFGTTFTYNHFYFPINIRSRIRIEPEIDMNINKKQSYSGDESDYIKSGIGLYRTSQKNKCLFYYGSRFKYSYYNYKSENNGSVYKSMRKNIYISPSLGGEYYLINRASLGVEIQIEYSHTFSEVDDYGNYKKFEGNGLDTIALFFMRFYLF